MVNGFSKEWMFFSRGGRLAAVLIVTLALAVASPIMFGMMTAMTSVMSQMEISEEYSDMLAMFGGFSASDICLYNIEFISGIGIIVIMFVLKGAAGGEQQKRSVIIPQCAGLSAVGYVLPKFVIYPLFMCAVTALSVYAGAGAAAMMFPGTLDIGLITVSAVCTGVYALFFAAVQLCIGICTGRSGAAIAICIVMKSFLPTIMQIFRADRFNPLALENIALEAAFTSGETGGAIMSALDTAMTGESVNTLNVSVSAGTAVVISVLLFFLTIYVVNTKEVHNEGDEPVL